ncbi:MAG: TonB-dependent receptor [Bacteroidales bacterium]|jgi:TonB-linked SusC/RagA family outer membrane protein|nr:TonB-dependent receptor [Bacteroidales bacterium]
MKKLLFILFMGLSPLTFGQTINIKGTVIGGTDNEPLIGVYVLEQGTTNGTATNEKGNYSLKVKEGSTIKFTYIGYKDVIMKADRGIINVTMQENVNILNDVVVIGYGTQKKSVVTASISSIDSKSLENVAPVRIDNALQGLSSGVTVTHSSGQPGSAAQVRIRGVGTNGNSDPLYIVDGMPIDGGIDYLNPGDIANIEILKDAASGAVYGARAANGVILITTKKGTQGTVNVNYEFSYGFQNPWRHRKVLNATEYALMMNEAALNAGKSPVYSDPYSYGKGTDWQDELFYDNAPVQSHQLSVSGANDKVNYYFSGSYYNQNGIIGGNYNRSNYKRLTIRSNTTYYIMDHSKERSYLNKLTAGINAAYTRTKSSGITVNSEYGSPLGSAVMLSPILKVYYDEEEEKDVLKQYETAMGYDSDDNLIPFAPVRDKNGRMFTIPGKDYNEIVNPLAALSLPGSIGNSDKLVSNLWAELTIWDHLKFKTSFGTDLSFWGDDGWSPVYYLGQSNKATFSSVWSSMNRSLVWQVENTLSYDRNFGKHFIQIMLGQSSKETRGRNIGGSNKFLPEENGSVANINFATGTQSNGDMNVYGSAYSYHRLASLFARLSYNYNERYMVQATVRRDGSSNFGPNNKFAIFPSVSLGWNITNENFARSNFPEWISKIKLRASWGKNGNEAIGEFKYTVNVNSGNNYYFGTDTKGAVVNGSKASGTANPDLRWEESKQTDIGLDLGFIKDKITFSADWYDKRTSGMLMEIPVPSYLGESKPTGNVGKMQNTGVEFDFNYKFNIGDVKMQFNANASYLRNKLLNLGNESGFSNYDNLQNVGTISRGQNGNPWPFFYGKKTAGIFQTEDEIKSYVFTDPETGKTKMIQPNAVPGDVKFLDINNDGQITDDDRTKIGKGIPDWTFGFSLNAEWKNLDLIMMWQGCVGNDVFDATRRIDISKANLPQYMLDRWTGKGTSNKYPRFVSSDDNGNWLSSDLYIKDGSYLRLKNLQIGFTLPKKWTSKILISNLRLYVQAENLLTLTRYEGFDPEMSSGGTSLGIDRGVYPQSRTYTMGLNLTF